MNPIKILLLAMVFFFSVDVSMAQTDRKEQRKMERAEKKRLKQEEKQRIKELIFESVEEQAFVLEANTLSGRYVTLPAVSPLTNFVKINGNRVVVQTANNWGFGYNGLGGITINGIIREYEVIANNEKSVTVLIRFADPVLGSSTLNLNVQANGMARAMVVDNWGRRATFQGQLVPLENARIFQGRSII